MFALAAFRRALPLKLACSFPPLHSHALMRALAFTLHLSSPLSPTRMVSSRAVPVVHVPRRLPHTVLLVPVVAIILPSFRLHHLHFFTFQSHTFLPPLLPHPAGLAASPFLLHLPPFSHILLFKPIYFFLTLRSPYSSASPTSSHHLSLFHPCQPAVMSDALRSQHWERL